MKEFDDKHVKNWNQLKLMGIKSAIFLNALIGLIYTQEFITTILSIFDIEVKNNYQTFILVYGVFLFNFHLIISQYNKFKHWSIGAKEILSKLKLENRLTTEDINSYAPKNPFNKVK